MRSLFKIQQCAIVIFVLFCSPGILTAAPGFSGETEANAYVMAEWFTWREFHENGARLLRLSGPRGGGGLTYNFEFFDHHLIVKPRIEIMGGYLDYEGSLQPGVMVLSKTQNFQVKLETDLGRKFGSSQNASIEPFVGIGFRYWDWDLENGTDIHGNHVEGYLEIWQTLYLRAGARGDIPVGEKSKLYAEGGVKYPIYNEATLTLSNDDVRLSPGIESSLFAEVGIKYKFFKAGIYYDSLRFSQSDVVYRGSIGHYQPKSEADMYGIRFGVVF